MVGIGSLVVIVGGAALALWSLSHKHWFLFLVGIAASVLGIVFGA